jgi:exosortase
MNLSRPSEILRPAADAKRPKKADLSICFLFLTTIFAFLFAYFETLSRFLRAWLSYEESHGLLILAVSLYMLWRKRVELSGISPRPSLLWGIFLTGLSGLLMHFGRVSSTWLLEGLAPISALLGLILLLGGTRYFRALAAPVGYLVFMLPVFDEALGGFSLHLQCIAAWIAANLLILYGVAVHLSAQYISLPYITLEVAKACNGINHITALVALAIPLAYLTQMTWAKRTLIIASSFLLGIFANGLRVALIGVLAMYRTGPIHGPSDLLYVSFVFFAGLALLLLVSFLAGSSAPKRKETLPKKSETTLTRPLPERVMALSMLAGTILLLAIGGYSNLHKNEPVFLEQSLENFPRQLNSWVALTEPEKKGRFGPFLADEQLHRVYRESASNARAEVQIAYLSLQKDRKKIINYPSDSVYSISEVIKVPMEEGATEVRRAEVQENGRFKRVYFWYVASGKVLPDRLLAKIGTLYEGLLHKRTNGGFVAVSIEEPGPSGNLNGSDQEFVQSLLPATRDYLSPRL